MSESALNDDVAARNTYLYSCVCQSVWGNLRTRTRSPMAEAEGRRVAGRQRRGIVHYSRIGGRCDRLPISTCTNATEKAQPAVLR
eukprot:364197-Chlamydomonas_euryale.AAC.25